MEIKVRKLVPTAVPDDYDGKIFIVGEAPGEDEALEGKPFIGQSGQLMNKMLKAAGIDRSKCGVTNTFRRRPPDNKVAFFFSGLLEAKRNDKWHLKCPYPKFGTTGYVKEEWVGEIERLKEELERYTPTSVVCMGAAALWALTGQSKIGKYRGTVLESTLIPGLKVIATYHPAFVLRNWSFQYTVVADLMKAKREAEFPEIVFKERLIYVEPSLKDMEWFYETHIKPLRGGSIPLAYDIETDPWLTQTITCIGYAPNDEVSMVIPFMDKRNSKWNYWSTVEQEHRALLWNRMVLEDRNIPKLGQNGLYDIQWLYMKWGIKVRGFPHDSMLLHHALQPELLKGLDYLGSLYSNEPAWKQYVDFKGQKENS